MPYIKEAGRKALHPLAVAVAKNVPVNAGELNYIITLMLIRYYAHNGHNYQAANDIAGACVNAAAEFYRRAVAPYEDTKIAENGDVYPNADRYMPEDLDRFLAESEELMGLSENKKEDVDGN